MSDVVEIRIHAGDFREWMRRLEGEVPAAARQVLGIGVGFALSHAKATQAFKDRTGELRRSISRGQKGPWSHFIKATAPHAAYVEFGTEDSKKGPIIATGRALVFHYRGQLMFRKSVKHKGMKATHFMQEAADVAEKYFDYYMEDSIAKTLRR